MLSRPREGDTLDMDPPDSADHLSEFRIEIGDSMLRRADYKVWRRVAVYVQRRIAEIDGATVTQWRSHESPSGAWVYRGQAPADVVTLLQAAARGDDLRALLDRFEGPEADDV